MTKPRLLDQLHASIRTHHTRAKRSQRIPVVLSRSEVRLLLGNMQGVSELMAALLYGAGLRLLECARLRVKDVDLEGREIRVRDGKGRKDRVTLLPERLSPSLARHLEQVREQHRRHVTTGIVNPVVTGGITFMSPCFRGR